MSLPVRFVLWASLVTTGQGACAPEVPYAPTWDKDIRPLMVARCIRCHDGQGHVDPATDEKTQTLSKALAAFDFNVQQVGDLSPAAAGILKSQGSRIVRGPLGDIPIMPPPPAEKLEDWEIELLDNWLGQSALR